MSLNPDTSDFSASCARIGLSACLSALAILMLAACSSRPPVLSANPKTDRQEARPATPAPAPATTPAAAAPAAARPDLTPLAAPGSAEQASAPALTRSALASLSTAALPADTVVSLLAYADRVRALPMPELFREIARLGNPATPAEQLQLALALSQLRQAAELTRAQELINRVLSNPSAQAQPLQPLARLLAARYADQRRLEDQLERQTQQLREVQRRLEQTYERLEALKAIERSLTSRPPAAAPAPASRHNRPAAP